MDNWTNNVDTETTNDRIKEPQPIFFTFLLLVVAVLVGSLIGNLLVLAVSQAWGVDLQLILSETTKDSPLPVRNFLRVVNLLSHLMTFSLPSILLIYFLYKKQTLSFFRLDRRPLGRNILYSVLFILVSFPMAQFTYWLNQKIPLPQWAIEMEKSAEAMLQSVLNMQSPAELLFNLLVVAVIPAIGEELLFRGVVQQKLEKGLGSAVGAVWITAILFSAIHLQFQGFFPRMILGAVLGYLLIWTRNLWIPIIAHFIFNGAQVLAQYFYEEQIGTDELPIPDQSIWISGLFSTALIIWLGYHIYNYNKNKNINT